MKFSEALNIRPGITAIIGGGGKTALMLTLAEELKGHGVIICTTTRIYPPEDMPVIMENDICAVKDALKQHGAVCVGKMYGEKLGPSDISIQQLAQAAAYVITEADGSKGMPLKAHGEHEPVIPYGADTVYVIGADGIGKTVAEAAHRPEIYAKTLRTDISHTVTPEDAAKLVDHGSKVLFNKVDDETAAEYGRRFAAAFDGKTVIASLKKRQILQMIEK